MSSLISVATGNFTSSSTWGLVDPTSFNDSEAANAVATTSYVESTGATTGVITCDGIALKIASRQASPTGTLSVHLAIAGIEVVGSAVTINVSDINSAAAVPASAGWYFFKFSSPLVLAGATSYTVGVKTSSANQVFLYSSTTTNWARMLRTTTNQAPAAGDQWHVIGEWTAAATLNSFTVTNDNTATTSFGPTVSGGPPQGATVGIGGTFTWGASASTNYNLKQKGILGIYGGGTWNMGTSGTRIPTSSTATLQFDVVANVDSGFSHNLGSVINTYGALKTRLTRMTADAAAAATVITLADTTGWVAGDVLAFASSDRTFSHAENKTILSVDSSTQVTLTAGLTNAHKGTATGTYGIQCEVINLTSNVKITGTSTTLQGYIFSSTTPSVILDNCEMTLLGSNTALKKGIDLATTTGSTLINSCAIHDLIVAGSIGTNITGVAWNNVTVTNTGYYNVATNHISTVGTTGTNYTFNNVYCILTAAGPCININDLGGTITNIVAASANGNQGILASDTSGVLGTVSGITVHSGLSFGWDLFNSSRVTVTNLKAYFNVNPGINTERNLELVTYINPISFGNGSANFSNSSSISGAGAFAPLLTQGGIFDSNATFSTPSAITMNQSTPQMIFESCTFGASVAHTQTINVISANTFLNAIFRNCGIAETTFLSGQANMDADSWIGVEKYNQTAGNHRSYQLYGNGTVDTTIFNIASPSLRMTPSNASNKLKSHTASTVYPVGFPVQIANGTTVTAAVYLRTSVIGDGTAYNGNAPRLFVRRNVSLGITADTLLATYSATAGTWQQVSGTTATVNDDGWLEFYVDCDGTTGWINVDDFTATPVLDTSGLKFFNDGFPMAVTNNTSGGGSATTGYAFVG